MNYPAAILLRSLAGELLAGSVLGLSIGRWFDAGRDRDDHAHAMRRPTIVWRALDRSATPSISRG